jgi:hypothetical protein
MTYLHAAGIRTSRVRYTKQFDCYLRNSRYRKEVYSDKPNTTHRCKRPIGSNQVCPIYVGIATGVQRKPTQLCYASRMRSVDLVLGKQLVFLPVIHWHKLPRGMPRDLPACRRSTIAYEKSPGWLTDGTTGNLGIGRSSGR